jgi:hypothetical protein
MKLIQLAAFLVALSSVVCVADSPNAKARSDDKLEVGKHYHVVVKEIDGDDAVTTTYWATVTKADAEKIVLADGEWNQSTGPAVKPRSLVLLNKVSSWIYRASGGKPNVGILGGIPMGEETVTLMRDQISKVRQMSETEFRERKEAHRANYPRPPHASGEKLFTAS